MTRDEWHKTRKFLLFRFANNLAADIERRSHELRDVLSMIDLEYDGLLVCDRFNVVERQQRVVSLEARRLWDEITKLISFLAPKEFDDMKMPNSDTGAPTYDHGSEDQSGTIQRDGS